MDARAFPTAMAAALTAFRTRLHREVYGGWSDTLFELTDALLTVDGRVGCVPALSLESVFRRSHGSLYKALGRGTIREGDMRRLLIEQLDDDWPDIFAVDASTWDRCDAECSPERGIYYHPSKHSAGQPIVAGWSYQWVTQLSWTPDSWTAPIDVRRIPPTISATHATIDQIRELVGMLATSRPDRPPPMFVFDAGYDATAIGHALRDVPVSLLTRVRDNRVFHARPPQPQPGTRGRPRRHGHRLEGKDPATWPTTDQTARYHDNRYGNIRIQTWHHLHPKLGRRGHWTDHDTLPIVEGTLIRVVVEHLPKATARGIKTLWMWHTGPAPTDITTYARAYLRRFHVEHTIRFAKQTLGWTAPNLTTPQQADRWTWLIIAAYTQLRLARPISTDLRLPWQKPVTEPDKLTPARIRRGFRRIHAHLPNPARPPKSSTPGPGRPKGTPRPPRTRHPAVKRTQTKV